MMKDPYKPTVEEIVAWAHEPGALCPVEDWDLIITNLDVAPLFLRLASDPDCPNRRFLLNCLYLLVGDAVRPGQVPPDLPRISGLLASAESSGDSSITRWVDRSCALLAQPEAFDYAAWCGGGLAFGDAP
jgi:hypothetical protein